MLAGCTATTIDTQGLQPLGATDLAANDFGLTDDTVAPTPGDRPTQADTIAQAERSQDTADAPAPAAFVADNTAPQADTLAAEAASPAAPGTQPLADATQDSATQRILQASNAPSGTVPENNQANAVAAEATQLAQATPTAAAPVVASATQNAAPISAIATAPAVAAVAPAPRRTGIFQAMFNRERVSPPEAVKSAPEKVAAATSKPETAQAERRVVSTVSARSAGLPGVNRDRALGVNKPSSGDRPSVQVASAAGLARLAPNGLKTQHSGVDIKCLKPALVRILKNVESHYGKQAVVTSGYRSPARNKKARGAKNSLHMYCAAADIQVPGVSKWKLASYLRSLPGRGGVGTYCHTKSVHIDIGPKRDWNARCRRR